MVLRNSRADPNANRNDGLDAEILLEAILEEHLGRSSENKTHSGQVFRRACGGGSPHPAATTEATAFLHLCTELDATVHGADAAAAGRGVKGRWMFQDGLLTLHPKTGKSTNRNSNRDYPLARLKATSGLALRPTNF